MKYQCHVSSFFKDLVKQLKTVKLSKYICYEFWVEYLHFQSTFDIRYFFIRQALPILTFHNIMYMVLSNTKSILDKPQKKCSITHLIDFSMKHVSRFRQL